MTANNTVSDIQVDYVDPSSRDVVVALHHASKRSQSTSERRRILFRFGAPLVYEVSKGMRDVTYW